MATFGRTTNGNATVAIGGDAKIVSSAVPASPGTVQSLTFRGNITAVSTVFKGVIYADDNGVPGALLATSDEASITNTVEQEWTAQFSGAQQINIGAGVTYWIGIHFDNPSSGQLTISADNNADLSSYNLDTYPGNSDPFGSATLNIGKIDAFVTYLETSDSIVRGKQFLYKVFNSSGNYIKYWNDVISVPDFSQELNAPGGEMVVVLGRDPEDFGEDDDVKFKNKVEVHIIDNESPTGTLFWQGYISNYRQVYGESEGIEITILPFSAELDNFMIESGEVAHISQTTTGLDLEFGDGRLIEMQAQTFQPTEAITLKRVEFSLRKSPTYTEIPEAYVELYQGTPGSGTLLATSNRNVVSEAGYTTKSFTFASEPALISGTTYHFVLVSDPVSNVIGIEETATIECQGASGNPYGSGAHYQGTSPGTAGPHTYSQITWGIASTEDLYFILYSTTGNTTVSFTSEDPSNILKDILDDYTNRGGTITYDVNSIDDTGTSVSYTFNVQTVLEGIKKVLELAPDDWYWYVDPATNLLHFHQKAGAAEKRFTLGKDISRFAAEKRTEDIINVVYFTGGGTPVLFKKYTATSSVNTYGIRIFRYTDQRVTLEATADIIGNNIINRQSSPELRTKLTIADNNLDTSKGYDIESIRLGEVISFNSFEGNSGSSLYDVAQYDVDFYDFHITDFGTFHIQIVRLEYKPNELKIICSSVPLDVNKRIEDIRRNLDNSLTIDNPTAPS